MAGYLLDTNTISALMLAPTGRLAQRIARAGEGNVFTSVIVAAELRYGEARRPSGRLANALAAVFAELPVLEWPAEAADAYAHIRLALERAGTPIGGNDLLIAAHALALDATLVSDNERKFGRIQNLKLENWLR